MRDGPKWCCETCRRLGEGELVPVGRPTDDVHPVTSEGVPGILGRALLGRDETTWMDRGDGLYRHPLVEEAWTYEDVADHYGPVREVLLVSPAAGQVIRAAERLIEAGHKHDASEIRELCAAVEEMHGGAMVGDRPAEPAECAGGALPGEVATCGRSRPCPDHDAAPVAADLTERGRCGAPIPLVFGGTPAAFCCLPAGHAGWHRDDHGTEWSEKKSAEPVPVPDGGTGWSRPNIDGTIDFLTNGPEETRDPELAAELTALLADRDQQAAEVKRINAAWWKMQAFRDQNADGMIAMIARLRAELAKAIEERDLAVAHDGQPYPTADAYEAVCATLAERTRERDHSDAALEAASVDMTKVTVERDRLERELAEVTADRDQVQEQLGLRRAEAHRLTIQVDRLRGELERVRGRYEAIRWAEALTEQGCAEGRHTEWFADTENSHACPWCEVETQRAELEQLHRRDGVLVVKADPEELETARRDGAADALRGAAARLAHPDVWADPTGRWNGQQAEAAGAQKQLMVDRLLDGAVLSFGTGAVPTQNSSDKESHA